ncbi:SPOSA6832_01219 [Sporobolomyces salmonicolor]|uniref:SPOSA6832_01219-mRNA-1:cds n=1 Tax=Sporidiobolus salmonicolor TaxID=5005 RepID=A0A0D6EIX0_SPOSA|nr:SPOSA6832_01219 [Sporobolomyces salmonicolor]
MVREMVQESKPLAYVLGTQPFHPLPIDLLVRPPTLIPRPETEHWVLHLSQVILESIPSTCSAPKPFRILDIGTGTGCIALGLAHSLLYPSSPAPPTSPFSSVHALAVDKSTSAISLASENATRCNLAQQVTFLQADVFADDFPSVARGGLGGSAEPGFDLVVSNPPYITLAEYARLDASVRDWEDRGALVGERHGAAPAVDDGLVFYRRITGLLGALLADSSSSAPWVAFEVGEGQARAVAALLQERGFKAETVSDPWGVERAVFGWRNANARG